MKRKKILLVNPATKKDRIEKPGQYKGSDIFRYPKLGALAIAGVTPPGYEVEIADETVDIIDFDAGYDIVGVSAVTALANRAYEIAAEFVRRGTHTVIGGCHATFLPDEAKRYFDAVICGLGEQLWLDFLNDFERGPANARKIYSSGAAPADILHAIPFPARFNEGRPGYAGGHVFSIMRGCSKSCDFCSINAFFGRRVYKRPIGEACAELKSLKHPIINLVDDNIYSDPKYAREFFAAVKDAGKHWLFQASTDIVRDRRLMKLLAEAGAKGVFVGFESISSLNLTGANKGHNSVDKYKRVIDVFHEFGIVVEAGMMFGFDDDGPDIFKRSFDFFYDLNLDLMQIAVVTPMPGTALYDRMKAEGRIISVNWDDYDCKHVVFVPGKMSVEELKNGTEWLRGEFYSYASILKRGVSNFMSLGVIGTLGYYLRGNLGFKKNHALGLDYPP
jgi:radical SAM superfamily enzyme YgiQ (UPF0313 family)